MYDGFADYGLNGTDIGMLEKHFGYNRFISYSLHNILY